MLVFSNLKMFLVFAAYETSGVRICEKRIPYYTGNDMIQILDNYKKWKENNDWSELFKEEEAMWQEDFGSSYIEDIKEVKFLGTLMVAKREDGKDIVLQGYERKVAVISQIIEKEEA